MGDVEWRRIAGLRVVMSWPESGYASPPSRPGGLRARVAGLVGVFLIMGGGAAVGVAISAQEHAPKPSLAAAGATGPSSGQGRGPSLQRSLPVSIDIPASYSARPIEFVAEMENLTIEPDRRQRIIINERTGTIVMGKDVRISPVAIMQGSLSVEVRTTLDVSQPAPLSQGKTTVIPETDVKANETKAQNIVLQKGATVEELSRALQAIGSTPRDIIAILQNMRVAGAIDAEIEGI